MIDVCLNLVSSFTLEALEFVGGSETDLERRHWNEESSHCLFTPFLSLPLFRSVTPTSCFACLIDGFKIRRVRTINTLYHMMNSSQVY